MLPQPSNVRLSAARNKTNRDLEGNSPVYQRGTLPSGLLLPISRDRWHKCCFMPGLTVDVDPRRILASEVRGEVGASPGLIGDLAKRGR